MDERPVKRARLVSVNEGSSPTQPHSHQYGNTDIRGSAPVHLGDKLDIQNHYYQQVSAHNTADSGVDKYEVLLKSLLFDRIDARVHNIKKALPKTCKWLFHHKHFKEWYTGRAVCEHNGFLWIKGKPGCGKSTIMKTALEWTRTHVQKESINRTTAYYFFNARAPSSLEKSSLGLYRSLCHQLLCSWPSVRSLFVTKFALKEPGDSGDSWTIEELQDFLSDVVTSAEPYCLRIFIDALDEGEREDDVRQMISFLVDLSERALTLNTSFKLRICLSSRHYPHISIKKGLPLVVEKQPEHDQDIDMYVRQKLTGSDGRYKDELRAEVCRKSASIFLWVVLVVSMLNEINDHGTLLIDMRARLDTIPEDLNDLFADILTKSSYGIEACIALLQWVLFSIRPLEPSELYLATEYSRSPAKSEWTPPPAMVIPPGDSLNRYVLNCSRGLVELASTQRPVVQFIHETVRDFLIKSHGLASLLPALSTNFQGLGHEILKTSCVRYISASAIPNNFKRYLIEGHTDNSTYLRLKENLCAELPFISYSVSNIFYHAEQAQKHGISQEDFLRSRIDEAGIWQGLELPWWNVLERFKIRKYSGDVTLLYFFTERGFVSLSETLLKASNAVNAECGRYACALQAACVTGSEEIVRCLIANGADVNLQGGEHGHALAAAIVSKNFRLVPVLHEHGARLDSILLRKTLFTTIARGWVQGVVTSLELGADANARNVRREHALYMAVTKKHTDIVRLLLEHGAMVNSQGGFHGNALKAASAGGHEQIARLLIEKGVDVNAQGGEYGNALQAASARGYEQIARLLIEKGADVNAQGGLWGNALQAASEWGHEQIARLLIEKGVDVNAQGGEYGNALHAALVRGHEQVARLLIEKGVDVNAQGGFHGNALQAASAGGHEQIARLLIEKGADVNAQGGLWGNALQAASEGGHEQIARLLIEKGVDVNAQGGEYGNALQAASARGHEQIARLLIEKGADVNAQGGKHINALQAASGGCHQQIARLLIEKGADTSRPSYMRYAHMSKQV